MAINYFVDQNNLNAKACWWLNNSTLFERNITGVALIAKLILPA
jgi:hypothetical protein